MLYKIKNRVLSHVRSHFLFNQDDIASQQSSYNFIDYCRCPFVEFMYFSYSTSTCKAPIIRCSFFCNLISERSYHFLTFPLLLILSSLAVPVLYPLSLLAFPLFSSVSGMTWISTDPLLFSCSNGIVLFVFDHYRDR